MNRRKFAYVLFLHVHAAVDLDNLACDVARHVGCEERGYVGDVVGLAAAAQGNFLDPLGAYIVGKSCCHGCLDEARSDGVGADTA